MKKYGIILISIYLIINSCVTATTYYVSNDGDDMADGTSEATAWTTIAKVNGRTFQPGDVVLFRKGDVWRESLKIPSSGNSDNYVVFSTYGTGDKPRILGSEQAATWLAEGHTNIWQATGTFSTNPWPSMDQGMELFFEEINGTISWGVHKTYTSDLSNLTQEYDWTWNSGTVYLYNSSDPGSSYSSIEVPQRSSIIDFNTTREYIEIDGFELAYGMTGVGGGKYPTGNYSGYTLRNCLIHHLGRKDGGGYGSNLCYNNSLIEYNEIHNCGRRSISIYNYGNAEIKNIVVQNNHCYQAFHTLGIDNSSGGGPTDYQQGSFDSIIIRNNLIEGDEYLDLSINPPATTFFRVEGTAHTNNMYIYNNIITFPYGGGLQFQGDPGTNGFNNIYIYNNTFYGTNKTTAGGRTFISLSGVISGDVVIKNNIFYMDAIREERSAQCITMNPLTHDKMLVDNNLYYCTDPTTIMIRQGSPLADWYMNTFTSLQSNWGWDANSPVPADPLFISETDYHLQPGSSAIGAGTDIPGYTTDFDGNPVSSPPSIGAFQGGGLFPGSIGSAQSICYNTVPAPLTQITAPSGGTGTYTYQWQSSPDRSNWTNINGATSSGYSPPTLLASTYFRRTVTSGGSSPVNSSSVLITVSPQITSAQLHDNILIANNTSTNFSIAITGGTSPYSFTYTRNGTAQSAINNYNSSTNISTGVLTTGAYIYALTSVTDAIGCEASNFGTSITITVSENANLTPGTVGSSQSVCYNTIPAPLNQITAPTGGTGSFTYQWKNSPDNSTWTDISGATLQDYSPPILTETTYYVRTVTSGSYIPVNSSPVQITIYPEVELAQLHDNIYIEDNTSTNINISVSGGISPFTVEYTRNDISQSTITGYSSGADISTGILTAGAYTYALTSITDANGCEAQSLGDEITVTATGLISGVPNVFTPNGDGINETWEIPSIQNFPDAIIRIYDRNLKEVIEYTGSDPDWDGRDSNGTPLPSGSYLYIIDLHNDTRPIKGYISLVK